MKTSELLGHARDRVAKGWCQKKFVDYARGEVCAVAAIHRATRNTAPSVSCAAAEEALGKTIVELDGFRDVPTSNYWAYIAITSFNDRPTTTKQDVLNLFDKTIIGLEEKGL